MIWLLAFPLAPLALYTGLVALPGGRGAAIGLASAAEPIGLLWITQSAGIWPFVRSNTMEHGLVGNWLATLVGALVLAVAAQLLRPLAGSRGAYPALCIGLAMIGTVPVATILGF